MGIQKKHTEKVFFDGADSNSIITCHNYDFNEMTLERKILQQYRYELGHRFKDPLGESAITEMTRNVRDNDPNRMDFNQLYSLFRLYFIGNKFHSHADFF